MKSTLGPGLSGRVDTVLWEFAGSPFRGHLEFSVSSHVCGEHQEVSPGWAACQFPRAVVTNYHKLAC